MKPSKTCSACNPNSAADGVSFCDDCVKRYPPSLLKATHDSFNYAVGMRTGLVVIFESAELHNDYATLHGRTQQVAGLDGEWVDGDEMLVMLNGPVKGLRLPFPRGLDVRVADIVWCADAPEGS